MGLTATLNDVKNGPISGFGGSSCLSKKKTRVSSDDRQGFRGSARKESWPKLRIEPPPEAELCGACSRPLQTVTSGRDIMLAPFHCCARKSGTWENAHCIILDNPAGASLKFEFFLVLDCGCNSDIRVDEGIVWFCYRREGHQKGGTWI